MLTTILTIIYIVIAWSTYDWFRYNFMGVRAEMIADTWGYYCQKFVWVVLLGWVTILIYLFCVVTKSDKVK